MHSHARGAMTTPTPSLSSSFEGVSTVRHETDRPQEANASRELKGFAGRLGSDTRERVSWRHGAASFRVPGVGEVCGFRRCWLQTHVGRIAMAHTMRASTLLSTSNLTARTHTCALLPLGKPSPCLSGLKIGCFRITIWGYQ